MKYDPRLSTASVLVLASTLGLLIAVSDLMSPFGDDSAQFSVFLWLVSSGVLGFARPRHPWRWAVSVGPWLPLVHLTLHVLGLPGSVNPNSYASILPLFPVSVAACLLGAHGGAFVRRLFLPPSPPPETGSR